MSKKILAVALAAAMILGLASVAFAASFSDTVGHEREAAIGQLAGIGLLKGYTDGTFRPEGTITRAEFATVIVRALGLEAAADMLEGVPTGYSDVPVDHWATGYINVATSQGIIKGYPDGTFQPEANVTYAEAITMIIRALGYENEPAVKNGMWPQAYLTKAAILGVTADVVFNASAPATRGNVAQLIANSLTIDRMVEKTVTDDGKYTYGVEEGNCFLKLMGATWVEGWLIDSPEMFTNNGTSVKLADGKDAEGNTVTGALSLADGVDVAGLLGHKVRVWKNKAGKVFFVEDLTPASSIKVGKVSSETKVTVGTSEVDLDGKDVIANYQVVTTIGTGPAEFALAEDDEVTLIYSGNSVKYVVVLRYTTRIVSSVNLNYDRITWSNAIDALTLKDWKVAVSGAAGSIADLQKDDVVQFVASGTHKKAILIVTRESVTGTFTRMAGNVLTIGGVQYQSAIATTGLTSYLGKEVTVLLDKDGRVVRMSGPTTSTSTTTAVLVNTTEVEEEVPFEGKKTTWKAQLVTSAGKTVVLTVASNVEWKAVGNGSAVTGADAWEAIQEAKGSVVTYTTNSDGAVNAIVQKIAYQPSSWVGLTPNYTLSTLKDASGNQYKVTASTIVFYMAGFTTDSPDPNKVVVKKVIDLLAGDNLKGAYVASDGKLTIVVLSEGNFGDVAGRYAVVTDVTLDWVDNAAKWIVTLLIDGVETSYVQSDLKAAETPSYEAGDVVTFEPAGDGEVKSVGKATAVAPAAYHELRVESVDVGNGLITVREYHKDTGAPGTTRYYLVDGETLFYSAIGGEVESIDIRDVAKGDLVDVYVEGNVLKVLVVTK